MKRKAFIKTTLVMGLLFVLAALSRWGERTARANELPTIVLIANHPDATMISNLRGELTALGMRVLVLQPGDKVISPYDLTEAARSNHAIAAFRVIVEEGRVEVWLADRVTGKVLLREVLVARGSNQSLADENMVVARSVELLRASLLELDIDERPTGEVVAPVTLPAKLQPPEDPHRGRGTARWGLTTSLILLAGSTQIAISPGLGLALGWHPRPHLGAVARLTLPFSGPTYVATQGRAQVMPRWSSVGLRWISSEFGGNFRGALESGLGLMFIDVVGIGSTGYTGRSSFDIDPVVYMGADLRYVLSHAISVSLALLGGQGLRPSKIVFDNVVIDRYGRLMVMASGGLDITWN